ncbi:hypothetical protein KDK77_02715 [bacterium]|nr:hypothetical protein [bacterium]
MNRFLRPIKRLFIPPTSSMRKNLIFHMTLLTLFIAGALYISTTIAARHGMEIAARLLVKRTVNQIEDQLQSYFAPVTDGLSMISHWEKHGLFNEKNIQYVIKMLVPLMEHHPQISAIHSGDATGRGHMILRDGATWLYRTVNPPQSGKTVQWIRWDESLNIIENWTEESDYDPRTRPWYEGIMRTDKKRLFPKTAGTPHLPIYWTKPYTFFTTKSPGITASMLVNPTSGDGAPFVIAFDILLEDISQFTMNLTASENGKAFVLTRSGRLVGLPRDEQFNTKEACAKALLTPLTQVGTLALSHCCDTWLDIFKNTAGAGSSSEPFPYRSNGTVWWGEIRPFFLNATQHLLIGFVIPESDLLGEIILQRIIITIIAVIAIAIAIILSHRLAKKYSTPIVQLVEQSESIRNLDLDRCPVIRTRIREINQLAEAQERMREALNSFARYVPTDVVRELLCRGEAARIGGRLKDLTILFTDIVGFTAITESMPPDKITAQMADYFERLLSVIQKHNGTVDKFIGDAIVAFWGAPADNPCHSINAVQAVNELQTVIAQLNSSWTADNKPPFYTRCGLSTGTVLVGNVGAKERLNYTALGDSVNIASRLENLNRYYGTSNLASETVYTPTRNEFVWRHIDHVRVQGKKQGIRIYELIGALDTIPDEKKHFLMLYEKALFLYQNKKFIEAKSILTDLTAHSFSDPPSVRLLGLCSQYIEKPPENSWSGITEYIQK